MTNAVEFHAVTRTFARSKALDDVSLAIPEESICGLLGRNGAGKTTMMSIIAGQDRPTSGRVDVFGKQPFENESTLAKINFVRDDQRYPDGYKLLHVLRIAPAFAPNWDADVAAELAEGLRVPTHTPIKKFSRGQLSSVAIILGLASRAPLTLLDEPYLGLDVTARRLFHDVLLRDYAKHPRTIVLSTHLIEESEALFDRVVIVDRGRIRADSVIDQVSDLAFTLTGSSDAVDKLTVDRAVLRAHRVGGLTSATVGGSADEETQSEARRRGVELAPASLQDLVAAFGEDAPPVATQQLDHARKAARA